MHEAIHQSNPAMPHPPLSNIPVVAGYLLMSLYQVQSILNFVLPPGQPQGGGGSGFADGEILSRYLHHYDFIIKTF